MGIQIVERRDAEVKLDRGNLSGTADPDSALKSNQPSPADTLAATDSLKHQSIVQTELGKVTRNISADDFKALVLNSTGLTIVAFEAEWCQWCKKQSLILDKIAQENGENLRIVTVDEKKADSINKVLKDNNQGAIQIQGYPTLAFFHGGELLGFAPGFKKESELKEMIVKAEQAVSSAGK